MRSELENQLPGLPTLQFEEQFVRPKPGRTLIVGSRVYEGREDRRPLFADAIGVDMLAGPGVDRVLNLEDSLPSDLGQFDHVECISVLEHSKRPWKLAANLTRLMSMGATIYLSAPFIWRVHNFPNDYFRYTRDGIRALFPGIVWQQLAYAHEKLSFSDRASVLEKGVGHPYMARTEVLGWGVRL